MQHNSVGRSDLTISAIGLGTSPFGREIDEETSRRLLDYALGKGIAFIDTAEEYGGGQAREYRRKVLEIDDVRETSGEMSSSERIIGSWLRDRGCRDDVTICTKVGTGSTPENINAALAASAERLGVDCVDIYMLHSPDPDVPIDESLHALDELVRSRRVGVIGCSNFSSEQLSQALAVSTAKGYTRFDVIQPIFSLAHPEAETDLFPLCRQEQIAVTAYSPLGAGFLTGKYIGADREHLPEGTRFHVIPGHCDVYFSERNFRVVERLRSKAESLDTSMALLAMAWAMSQPDISCTLVGARKMEHIDNALAAFDAGIDPALRQEMSDWA